MTRNTNYKYDSLELLTHYVINGKGSNHRGFFMSSCILMHTHYTQLCKYTDGILYLKLPEIKEGFFITFTSARNNRKKFAWAASTR